MMDNIIFTLEQLTKMSYESQNQTLRSFIQTDVEIKLQIIRQQMLVFHKLKSVYRDVENAVLTLASLIISIDRVLKELDLVNINAMKLKIKSNRTKSKRQKLFGLWAIIKTLKNDQNMSFRQIAKYCHKFHKFEISHSMIQQMWIEIEKIGEKNER